jgi:starvation-inducible DNA-binding protein
MKTPKNPSIEAMNALLSVYTVMSQNARFCHWNVVGPHFEDDHEFFGDLYDELSESVDLFAERIRALREFPVSRLTDILKTAELDEYELPMTARNMQKNMLKDYESLSAKMAELAELTSDDVVTQDIIVGEKRQIDKRAWMMRAMLGE